MKPYYETHNQIVSFSGGKDSTAMLLMMIERKEPIHSVVFFDTGWEFPEMIEHINQLEIYTGIEIIRLKPKISFNKIIVKKSWPQMWFRWCTGEKRDILATYHGKNKPYIKCVGYASDEKKRTLREKNRTHKGCSERYPLIEYDITEKQALQYCYDKGFDWGGLYKLFGRVSCFCCPLKKLNDSKKLRKHRPELWGEMLKMDKAIILNRGFRGYKTVHDLDKRFENECKQLKLF